MAEVVLFHHYYGQTPGFFAFADELRRAGHIVHTPDMYDGVVLTTVEEAVAHERAIGNGRVIGRAVRGGDDAARARGLRRLRRRGPARRSGSRRPGPARSAPCCSRRACPSSATDGRRACRCRSTRWPTIRSSCTTATPTPRTRSSNAADHGELFLYPGDRRHFADSSLPDHDPEAAALLHGARARVPRPDLTVAAHAPHAHRRRRPAASRCVPSCSTPTGRPTCSTVIDRLTFLQLDPTAAIAPSADLITWSRIGNGYRPADLVAALEHDRTVFEQRSQDVAIEPPLAMLRPMADLALHLADMAGWSERWPRAARWVEANDAFRRRVLDQLAEYGPAPVARHPRHVGGRVGVERVDTRPERHPAARVPARTRRGRRRRPARSSAPLGHRRACLPARRGGGAGGRGAIVRRDERRLRALGIARPAAGRRRRRTGRRRGRARRVASRPRRRPPRASRAAPRCCRRSTG